MEVLLIYSLIASERRQEVQEERRRNGRTEPYVNYLAAPDPHGAAPDPHGAGDEMLFARLTEQRRQRQFSDRNSF